MAQKIFFNINDPKLCATTTTTTGIHATDQLLVSTTPYYAHLYPLLLRARGALQDLDRTPQEPGHYDDYHDRHPRNGSAPCLDDALLRAPLPPSTSRERSTARLGPHPARARTLRRLPRPTSTQRISSLSRRLQQYGLPSLRRLPRPTSTQRISSLSRRRPTTRTFTPFYFALNEIIQYTTTFFAETACVEVGVGV